MNVERRAGGSINRLVPVLLALFLGGCALPRGHREGYVVLGIDGPNVGRPEKGSLAERIGLTPGKQIVSVNGTDVRSPADIQKISESLELGDKVEFKISTRTPEGLKQETLEATVEESDIGRSSNYLVYGYEKIGDRTRRRWLHLGLVSFGDWTGNLTDAGFRSKGVHVDVLPERIVRVAAVGAYLIPKFILLGHDLADRCALVSLQMPTAYVGTVPGMDSSHTLANASLFMGMWGEKQRIASLWPAGGYLVPGEENSGFVYLTPFNSVGWGDDQCKGVTLAGIAHWRPDIKGLLPVYSYVDPKG